MSRLEELKALIRTHDSRLQILKIQKAKKGSSVESAVIIEIEDIEEELKELIAELEKIEKRDTAVHQANAFGASTVPENPQRSSLTKTILILAANPTDTSRLRLDQEVREIDNGLQRAKRRDEYVLEQKWAVRPADVRRAMLDLNPNIVHFCGHGAGEGIAFEDETGQAKLVSSEALTGLFQLFSDELKCVVLNACYSEIQAESIVQHIDYVIGMKKEIGDVAAIEFAVAFYDALGAGKSVEFAYKLACNAIQWTGMPEHLTPVLKSKSQSTKGVG